MNTTPPRGMRRSESTDQTTSVAGYTQDRVIVAGHTQYCVIVAGHTQYCVTVADHTRYCVIVAAEITDTAWLYVCIASVKMRVCRYHHPLHCATPSCNAGSTTTCLARTITTTSPQTTVALAVWLSLLANQ